MTKLFSLVLATALFAGSTGCGMLSSPVTQREQTTGIGALGGGAVGAIIGSLTGSALAGGLVGMPLGAVAGFYIGDQMSRSEARREAEKRATDKQLADLRDENERLRRQSGSREEPTEGSALASADKPSRPAQLQSRDLPPSNVTIAFDFDRSALNGTSHESLTPIVSWLKADAGRNATVVGYTDSIGSDLYNLKLSERRAQAVSQYLIQNGVRTEKINVRGMGEANPVAPNDTEGGRQRNRRVEVILKGGVNPAASK
jgi:outer membrane protein OmpA-like peptidoglycan-associated protein